MLTPNCGIPGQTEQHITMHIVGGFKVVFLASHNRRIHPSHTQKCTQEQREPSMHSSRVVSYPSPEELSSSSAPARPLAPREMTLSQP